MVTNPLLGRKVYIDSNSFIYAVETPLAFPGLQSNFVQPFLRGDLEIFTSWITLSEVLVKPLQNKDGRLESYYRQLVRQGPSCTVVPVDESIASLAVGIRSQFGLRLPDALHVASGKIAQCDCFLTRDTQWAKAGVKVVDPTTL